MYQLKALWRFQKKSDEVFCPLGVSPKSRMFSLGRRKDPRESSGGEKSNPRDKRDLLDHRTACQADFTLRKHSFKFNFSIFWRKFLWKSGGLKRLRCTIVGFEGTDKSGNFFATESQVEGNFELQRSKLPVNTTCQARSWVWSKKKKNRSWVRYMKMNRTCHKARGLPEG